MVAVMLSTLLQILNILVPLSGQTSSCLPSVGSLLICSHLHPPESCFFQTLITWFPAVSNHGEALGAWRAEKPVHHLPSLYAMEMVFPGGTTSPQFPLPTVRLSLQSPGPHRAEPPPSPDPLPNYHHSSTTSFHCPSSQEWEGAASYWVITVLPHLLPFTFWILLNIVYLIFHIYSTMKKTWVVSVWLP